MASEPETIWQLDGFDQPESVVSDPKGRFLYISNINGQPMELNRLGYVSRVTVDGRIVDQKWFNGLNAPKGMAVANGLLYVADMQVLHVIDLESAKVVKQYSVPNAKMLNDVTVSNDGVVFVSDLLGGGIYRLQNGNLELWLAHPSLPHPNGVLWHEGELLAANWGEGMQSDFSTKIPGTLYRIDNSSRNLTPQPTGYQLGNLDGIVADNGGLYVSDWKTGELYHLANNERQRITTLPAGLADIGGAGDGVIYAPLMMNNRVLALKVIP
ncbi:MAG: hypothetical protein MI864_13530 [Pseudomonadales bacterium]|nr:hypothetical protein [Pseudomonadales bacterium]